ncbi:ensconsin isoform X2 [Gouania willdenowi]|uniref:Ensconsin-like n=1 Tax=Gouania willdenowi TaxID=441366 RepID=A0A8C5HLK2_GOUWI|nr:ensconsin-like isoform X2 [Gouania willdenowi]
MRGGGGLSQSIGMPASVYSMAVQKKQSVIPPSQGPLSTRTIESQKKTNRLEKRENGSTSTTISQTKKSSVSPKKFGENWNKGPRKTAGSGTDYDERLKAVRKRKEEYQKLVASRELDRLKREEQARRLYEQQLQERKKKLLEQRQKEENRRAVVEEKRQQRLKEEKERNESAVRKTQEKSQRAIKLINENLRGRKSTKNVSRHLPLTAWEKNLVTRLLTPTYSYLARSKSAGCQSGQEVFHVCRRAVSFHSTNTSTTPSPQKPQQHSAAVFQRLSVTPSANNRQQRTNSPALTRSPRQQSSVKIHAKNDLNSRQSAVKASTGKHGGTASPSPQRSAKQSTRRRSSLLQQELPSVPEEDVTICSSALSPGNSRPVRTFTEGQMQGNSSKASRPNPPDREKHSLTADNRAPSTAKVKNHSAGTTNPKDGYGSLAEKKRQAHLQRESEEKERLQQEEAERQKQQELELRRAEERARQQAEAELFLMEKMRREEEEQRQAEEERAQALREAALLQKRREEEQAKAEQMKQEQQLLAQKAEAERQVRKKRLEEIMRRTRRTDSPDTTSVPARVSPKDTQPKENTEPMQSDKIEDAVRLPRGTKTAQLLNNEADMVPAVAFKERSSLRMISGLEEIQAHQRAEVI